MRFFNTTGPINRDRHYQVPPLSRIDLEDVLRLIQEERYFVLRAPRQTGKTSTLLALADRLNASDKYRCLYLNVEAGQAAREDVGAAIAAVLSELASRASEIWHDDSVLAMRDEVLKHEPANSALKEVLVR